ncbi:(d)CMP kinase [Caldisalinibacter kiritimatiensis]|uniref:Cytidylate kinase n=1 Tax=Caldisalinibacter kiritimatiensis TaxID=1304284 RepID=R1CSK6_9FIRM|nr:(d)CMP kinase [Caldisalinibacter kiritimatiensis]EOD01641.1 Cytidylate kinase [Caldisalinibacter kiritimatiensis]
MKKISIAIDGPAGAGKSTISKKVAKKLNINYIDTGAMYRAVTLKMLNKKIDLSDKENIIQVLKNTKISYKNNHIYLDDELVDNKIRTNEVSNSVSYIAKIKEVRDILVEMQRRISKNTSVIMDGRDIGSNVLPNADYKFFVTASVEERGRRRYLELKEKGINVELNDIIEKIKTRDKIDSTRAIAPLKKCKDAIVIDTTNKTIDECIDEILSYIVERR